MKRATILLTILLMVISVAFANTLVDKGKELFNDKSLGTNGKSCSTCHPEGKKINGKKKTFIIKDKKFETVEDAINFCIEHALSGKPLAKDSEDMKALASYVKSLKFKKKKKRKKIITGC